jgi:hypothetical protein
MATVRISKDLLESVKHQIDVVSNSVHTATIEPRNPLSSIEFKNKVAEAALLQAWKGYEHLRTVVPVAWLKKVESLDVRIGASEEYKIPGSFIVPPTTKGYGSYVDITIPVEDAPSEVTQALRSYSKLEEDHENKFVAVKQKVISFLKSCKSVNDAVKKYPDVALYLSKSVLSKLEEVSERKAREKEAQEEDAPQGLSDEDRQLLTSTGVVGAIYNTK